MKKLLSLVLVLALCSVASAGLLDLKVASRGPTESGTIPIDPVKDITINPSEYLDLNIYYTSNSPLKLASISADIVVTGPGTLSGMVVGTLTEPTNAWDVDLRWITEVVAGKHYIIDYSMNNGVAATGVAVVALDHLMFHCDGAGPVTITMTNNLDTNAGDTIETNMARLNFGGPVTITQVVPEPATIALLCIGGLLLRKKK